MEEQLPDAEEIFESYQDRLTKYNENFDRVDGLLGEKSLLESDAKRVGRVENTKDMLSEIGLPISVSTVIDLAANAESESVRYQAAKFIIALNLGKDPAMQAIDPAMELINRLRGVTEEDND